jgi:hypothetical protein
MSQNDPSPLSKCSLTATPGQLGAGQFDQLRDRFDGPAAACGSGLEVLVGTPRHSWVVSPCLANLFLHYAFDMWMASAADR